MPSSPLRRLAAVLLLLSPLTGCTVIAVTGAAVGVATTAAGVAVDATVGAVKLTGKAVGAAADAVLPDGEAQK